MPGSQHLLKLNICEFDNEFELEVCMSQRVALYLQDAHDLRDGLDYVRYAEQRGFEAVWQAESRLVRDAIVPMAAYAAVTEQIKVGSGVINNWTRNIGSAGSNLFDPR